MHYVQIERLIHNTFAKICMNLLGSSELVVIVLHV